MVEAAPACDTVDMTGGTSPFGRELRYWRGQRGLSQLDLAEMSASTSRHISFLESGRSRPSAVMVERLCEAMAVPVRERNALFEAAGLAAAYDEIPLDDPELAPYRFAITSILERHDPFPGFAFDLGWNIVLANPAAEAMMLGGGERNLARLMFEGPFRAMMANWETMAWATLARLRHDAAMRPHDRALASLVEMATRALAGIPRPATVGRDLVLCPVLIVGGRTVSTVTVTARFGAPRTTSTDELQVDLIFPETDEGRAILESLVSPASTQV